MPYVGEAISQPYFFSRDGIAEFAERCGDVNPLHRDEAFAARSRFGGVIACGPHANAVHMSIIASHYVQTHEMVGLEFSVRFVKAIPADTPATLAWTVVEVAPNAKLGGELVALEGSVHDQAGTTYLTGRGRIVVWPKRTSAAVAN